MNFDNIYIILDKSKMIVHNIFLDEICEFKNINNFLNSVEGKNIYITNTKKFPVKLEALIFNLYSFTETDTKMIHQSLNSLYIRQNDNISLSSAVFPYKTTMEIKSDEEIYKMVNNSKFLNLKKEFLDSNNYYKNGQDFNNLKKYYHQKINYINITFDKEINSLKERLKLININSNDSYKKILNKIENKTQSKLLKIQETKLSFLKKLKLIYHQNNNSLTTTNTSNPVTKHISEPVTKHISEPVTKPISEPVTKPISEPVTKPISEPVTKHISEPVTKPVSEPVNKQVRNTKLFEEYNDRISNIKFLKSVQKNIFVLYSDNNQIESFTKKSNQHLKYHFIKKTSLSDTSVARYNRIRQNFVNQANLSCFDLIKIFQQVKSEFFMILDISINQDKNFFSKLSQIKIEKKNSCVILANPSNSTLSLENIGLIFRTIYVKGTLLPFIKKRLPKVSDLITKLPNTVMYADFLCKEPSNFDGTITGDKLNHRILKDIQESCMVINLKKDYQKKEILLTNNQHTNINFCFIDGVDGSIEDLGEINPKVMDRNTIRNKNQLAYLYSTYLALRAGVTLDSRYFMVLDDDVIFHKNFVEEFLKLDIPEDFNVIRLGISPNHNEKFNMNIVKSKNFNNGSFATIYKTSYVKNNLLDRVKTLNILYDHLFPFLENSYDLTEPLVIAELYSSSIMNIRNMKEFADKFNWNLDNFNFLDSQRLASVIVKGDDENKVSQIIKCLESQHYQNHQIYIENDDIRSKKIGTNLKLVNEIGEFKVDISNIENSNWLSNKMKEYICSKNKLGKNKLTVTIFSSLFNCDKYIDNYIFCLENLKDFDLHKMIIWNITDSNNNLTNEKIRKFCISKTNVTLLEKTKSQDNGLYDSWNSMLDMIDTELVCNYNADDKLHPNYIIDYVKEFNTDSKLNLVFSPLTVSRDLNDSFHMNLPLMFNTKMIFFNNEENVGDNEPEHMNLEYKIKILNDYEDGKINVSKKNVMYENLTIFDFFKNKGNILKMEDWIPRNLVGCAPMWRKSLYDKYGGFNEEEFKAAADFDLWLRFFSNEGNFKILDKPYVIYYWNNNSYFHRENNDDIHKKLVKKYINTIIENPNIETVINNQLIYYYNNTDNFIIEGNKIIYENNLFFEGEIFITLLQHGKLYNLKNNNLLYNGQFINGLPSGLGKTNVFDGYWINGKFINKKNDEYYLLDIYKNEDYNLYQNYFKYNKGNLIFSNKYRPGGKFIYDNLKINYHFKNLENKESIKVKNFNKYKLYYYDNDWQIPVKTEKHIFDLLKNRFNLENNFFSYPWATLLDDIHLRKKTYLLNNLLYFKVSNCATICQHISYYNLLPLLKKIGITKLYASHCNKNDYILENKYNIKIIPFSLYPINGELKLKIKKNIFISFVGSHNKYYLSNIRNNLKKLQKYNDCLIKINSKWHFHDFTYNNKYYNNDENYSQILANSTFSLCPSGTGPNSIRLWESLSYGSIPIILSNNLKLKEDIDWDSFCIFYDEYDNIDNLYKKLKDIEISKINQMKDKGLKIYNTYFNKKNFLNQL